MKGKAAPNPEIAAAAKGFRRWGGLTRMPKSKGLKNAFWSGTWLVLVQVNPRNFPDPYSRQERTLIEKESMRDGKQGFVVVAWVKSAPPDPPVLVKTKNLQF